ncbi:MAG: DNA methyltransferase, partial [Gemmatimonadales bacterium]
MGNVLAAGRTGNVHHTTEKPVAVLATILNVTHFARMVLDPFLGSGSTIVAAEQEGRTCLGMELDPEYVAMALERCQQA